MIINSAVGNIHISEITNKCDIDIAVGNITIDKISIQENSTIKTSTGNITINNSKGVYIDSADKPKYMDNTSQTKLKISCMGKITIDN